MKLSLYWSYATRSLLRGGQRSILAVFCVAVGVMAIVALQLVGLSVNRALLANIVEANGGDIRVNGSVSTLRQSDLAVFQRLKQQGRISDYATTFDVSSSITLPSGTEVPFDLQAVSRNFPLTGQPDILVPSQRTTLQALLNGSAVAMSARVFQQLGAHIGARYRVKTLDGRLVPITVAAEFQEGGAFSGPQILIAQSTLAAVPGPDGTQLISHYSTIYITVGGNKIEQVQQQIRSALPTARIVTAQDLLKQRQREVEQIQLFLRIVGLLALFIGGIGIINTMQVLLRRRQVEIAMLKTTGYRQYDLYGLFGLEAALLGIVGGIIGTLAGIGASYLVGALIERTFMLRLPVVLDQLTIGSGLLIGLATALIFGLLPIVQASQVRPLAVLRESQEGVGVSSRLLTVGLLVLLSLLFVALASTILGDIVTAVIAVYGGFAAIFVLALALGGLVLVISRLPVYERPTARMLLWLLLALGAVMLAGALAFLLDLLATRLNALATHAGNSTLGIYILVVLGGLGIVLAGSAVVFLLTTLLDSLVMFAPRSWKTPVMLAYRNIGRQRVRTTTTLTALFVGVFAIGLVLVLGQGIKDTINTTLSTLFTRNVFVVVAPKQQSMVSTRLAIMSGIDTSKTVVNTVAPQLYPLFIGGQDTTTVLKSIHAGAKITQGGVLASLSSLQGFYLKQGGANIPTLVLKSGRNLQAADAGTSNVVVSSRLQATPLNLQTGDTLIVQSADGRAVKELRIVGFYDSANPQGNPNFAAILADAPLATQLGGPSTLAVFSLKVNPDDLPAFKQSLTRTVPQAFIISIEDIDALINQVLNNLIVMLTTIASLAMIAGLVIIANAVALAMLERRREIGILKALGYTSRSVLATVMIENGLIGLLGALVAMLLVTVAITVLSRFVFQIQLSLGPTTLALVIVITTLLTILVSVLVSWRAVSIRPLEVLRYE